MEKCQYKNKWKDKPEIILMTEAENLKQNGDKISMAVLHHCIQRIAK